MANVQYYGTGRRKHSVARVRLVAGEGNIIVNGRAVEEYFNVSTQHYVDTYCQCCVNVGVQNTGTIPVLVDNPNITVVRVC